jgi:cation diffusion facilitator family transporter
MVAEITAGLAFNSMALLADGWHMGTHAFALGLAAFAYAYARRHATDPRFAFGVWKVEALGGYTSALVLLLVAGVMAWESIARLRAPLPISFEQALLVAVLGLAVNLICAAILHRSHEQTHHGHHGHHGHDHEAEPSADHAHDHEYEHEDLNLRSAYLHVIADAATSMLAIAALLGGRWLGWNWLDPVMGIVGAVLVAWWARGLIRDASRVLLDAEMDGPMADRIRSALVDAGVHRLHILRIGRDRYVCLVGTRAEAAEVRQRLAGIPGIALLFVDNFQKNGGDAA